MLLLPMNYNFDEIVNRRGSNSYKWDTAGDALPMWVADMDFKTAPAITAALAKRVAHGVFGYAKVPDAYYEAIQYWFSKRYNFSLEKEWLLYTTGVVPALSAIIKALTKPGDKIIVQNPAYNCFFSSIRNNDCIMVANNLVYHDGGYRVDLADLEQKAADPAVKLLLLCNPHNPVGRSWTKEELTTIGTICIKHNVFVVSDEIHCDLDFTDKGHLPFGSLSTEFLQHSVTCLAPSKTFNLAGLQVANIVVADPVVRKKIDKALNINEVCEINPFAIEAVIAAYNEGSDWLVGLKDYLLQNYQTVKAFFEAHLTHFSVLPLEATYLVWIDCSVLKKEVVFITDFLKERHEIMLNPGTLYGEAGEGFIRINIACPKAVLLEGLQRLQKGLCELLTDN